MSPGSRRATSPTENRVRTRRPAHLLGDVHDVPPRTLKNVDKLFDDGNPDNDGAACDKLASFAGKVAEQEAAGTLTATEAGQLTVFAQASTAANGCASP